MAISALILYGSCARGDSKSSSDIDLMAVVTTDMVARKDYNELNISFYSERVLEKGARNGSLFILHVIKEGKIIYGDNKIVNRLDSMFRLKKSYAKEITDASGLGWFLIDHVNDVVNWALFNKRIGWCIRTILISKAAEVGRFIFSANALSEFSGSPSIETLINGKDLTERSDDLIRRFKNFLMEFGDPNFDIYSGSNLSESLAKLRLSRNIVGQSTVSLLFDEKIRDYII